MSKYAPNQSALSRAFNDTISAQRTARFMWMGEGVLGVAGGAWLATIASSDINVLERVLRSVFGFLIGLIVAMFLIFVWNLIRSSYKQRNEARIRNKILEEERVPKFVVSSHCGRRQYDNENPYLMWAELQVTNTSSFVTLRDVEVQISTCLDIIDIMERGQNAESKYHLYDRGIWSKISVLWSTLDVYPASTKIDISPGATKIALLAFQNNSNGIWTIYNTPISPKPMSLHGAKIELEITSIDAALWKGSYYIECHPQYTDGTLARFEFVEWETWLGNHNVAIKPLISDK